MMKAHSSLIGLIYISNYANARHRFFLAKLELLCYSSEFKGKINISAVKTRELHHLQPRVIRHEHDAISMIKAAILSHGNPFAAEVDQFYNFTLEFVHQILMVGETRLRL